MDAVLAVPVQHLHIRTVEERQGSSTVPGVGVLEPAVLSIADQQGHRAAGNAFAQPSESADAGISHRDSDTTARVRPQERLDPFSSALRWPGEELHRGRVGGGWTIPSRSMVGAGDHRQQSVCQILGVGNHPFYLVRYLLAITVNGGGGYLPVYVYSLVRQVSRTHKYRGAGLGVGYPGTGVYQNRRPPLRVPRLHHYIGAAEQCHCRLPVRGRCYPEYRRAPTSDHDTHVPVTTQGLTTITP